MREGEHRMKSVVWLRIESTDEGPQIAADYGEDGVLSLINNLIEQWIKKEPMLGEVWAIRAQLQAALYLLSEYEKTERHVPGDHGLPRR